MFTTSEFILQNLLPQSILCPSSELTTQKNHHLKSAHEPHCEFREADLNIALSIMQKWNGSIDTHELSKFMFQ